jgi:hypothetical protein
MQFQNPGNSLGFFYLETIMHSNCNTPIFKDRKGVFFFLFKTKQSARETCGKPDIITYNRTKTYNSTTIHDNRNSTICIIVLLGETKCVPEYLHPQNIAV